MRILHVIHSADPVHGGPIEGVKQRGTILTAVGHTVEVASMDPPDAAFAASFPLPLHMLGPGRGKFGYAPRAVPWLRRHARDYDLVIVNGVWSYNGFATWRALRGTGVPYYLFTHGMLDPWFNEAYPLKKLKKYLYWLPVEYRVLRDARAVLFTAEEEKILARRSFRPYKCREVVVAYGVPGPTVNLDAARAAFLARFPGLAGERCLLFLSRIAVKKGIDLLLRAFAQYAPADWRLIVAGPDNEGIRPKLEALAKELGIADRVVWTGMVAGELKWGAFATCEAFVLPSHQENFGIAVVEALACGKPVLISRKVNIWREVEADGAALVEPDDQPGTDRLIQRWAALDADERAAMGARARKCFDERYEGTQAAHALVDFLERDIEGLLR